MGTHGKYLVAMALLLNLGCDWRVYDEFETTAPTIAISPSDDFASGTFGSVLVGWSGARVSRLGVTGGPNEPFAAYTGWDGSALRIGNPIHESCQGTSGCGGQAGTAAAGVASWAGQQMCLFVTAPESGLIRARCDTGMTRVTATAGARTSEEFGASIAALPRVESMAVAVIGAPAKDSGAGGVYLVRDDNTLNPAEVTGLSMVTGNRLGTQLAAGEVGGQVRVAIASQNRVVIASITGPGAMNPEACLNVASPRAMVMADSDGDGSDELYVLSGGELLGYDLSGVSGGCGSMAMSSPANSLSCSGCEALSHGDLNADGTAEVVAGAPGRSVDGVSAAGAVEIFCGASVTALASCATLSHSTPSENARLGSAVTTLGTNLDRAPRAEVVASALGENRVYVFTCSGLSGDVPGADESCVAR